MLNLGHRRLSFPTVLTVSFLLMILIGSSLLMLPIAGAHGQATDFIDALFVSTSAVCVTGLTTVTTATHWSFFGQVVLAILVEVGGLGFMTFAVMLANLMRHRLSFGARMLTEESLNLDHPSQLRVIRLIIRLSLLIQLGGAALLFCDFGPRFGWAKGLWYSVFHAVTAYCNAGFDLFGPSLVGLNHDPFVLMVIALLICAGSFGFLVWRDILTYHRRHRITLHTRLALVSGGLILGLSIIAFLISEHNLSQFSDRLNAGQRLANTIFLAVTPRTAGFFSVPYPQLSTAGLIITIVLMFIGGTPGSTAGGIKTNTVAVLFLQCIATFRGQEASFHHRRFAREDVTRALTLFVSAIGLLLLAVLILAMTQPLPTHDGVTAVIFEAVSAFGTVGLTLGLTPHLTILGKLIIILLMFIGRVGLYTFMFSIFHNHSTTHTYCYPKERIIIG